MDFLKIFHRKRRDPKTPPQPLRIEGCTTRLTPEPDDAELAAQALLDSLTSDKARKKVGKPAAAKREEPKRGSVEYYQRLSDRIRESHALEARRAKRYLAYCEEQIGGPLPADGLSEIERGLFRHQDCVEREGGKLLGRWRHVLAVVTVRQMDVEGT